MTIQAVAEPFPGWTAPAGMEKGPRIAWGQFYRHVWAEYRLTPAEYRAIYLAQLGRCYVCRTAKGVHPDDPKGKGGRRLAVDHNHLIRGRAAVRGLLCSGSLSADTCNRLIARYDHAALRRAMRYLEESPAQQLLARLEEDADIDPTGLLT